MISRTMVGGRETTRDNERGGGRARWSVYWKLEPPPPPSRSRRIKFPTVIALRPEITKFGESNFERLFSYLPFGRKVNGIFG